MTTDRGAAAHQAPRIVCVGLATADLLVEMPHWPERDGRLVVEPMRPTEGGPAATAAVAAARLGASVAFVGVVGEDIAGERVREALRAAGVGVDGIAVRPGATAASVVLLDRSTATRTILHAPGPSMDVLPPSLVPLLAAATWIHVDHAGWPLVSEGPRERVSVDAGNPIRDLDLAGLGLYGPSEAAIRTRYAGTTLGAAIRAALDEGAERVVVTLGAAGAVAADAGGAWHASPPPVEVRSTVGAGDVFHGAIVAELAAGRPLRDALGAATVAAALSCRGLDGREAIPSAEELAAAVRRAPSVDPILLDDLV